MPASSSGSYFKTIPRCYLRNYRFAYLKNGAVAQRLEQVSFEIIFKGQSKLTSYTFDVQVAGSNPVCSTINGQ